MGSSPSKEDEATDDSTPPLQTSGAALYYEDGVSAAKSININQGWTCDDEECTYFNEMKSHKFSDEGLFHLETFHHPQRIDCDYGTNCNAFQRLAGGRDRFLDRYHMAVYKHPPREVYHQITAKEFGNYQSLAYLSSLKLVLEEPDVKPGDLAEEVVANGFGHVLTSGTSTVQNVVNEKLQHVKHKSLGSPLNHDEMMAIILYTGCDCYKDLRDQERNGNYEKWAVFSHNLSQAIRKLGYAQRQNKVFVKNPLVYQGMNNVKIDAGQHHRGFCAPTFMSSTVDRRVAELFMKGSGVLLIFETANNTGYCDVSWISKFPDEREYLWDKRVNFKLGGDWEKLESEEKSVETVDGACEIWRFKAPSVYSKNYYQQKHSYWDEDLKKRYSDVFEIAESIADVADVT